VRKLIRLYGGPIEVTGIQTLREQIDQSLHQDRLIAALCSAFAVLALVLTCVGLHGVLSFAVARRTHEMGIRAALGARPDHIFWLVAGQSIRLAVAGVTLGIIGTLLLTRFLSSVLYGVRPTDPLTLAGVALLLSGVALLASYIPARRAMKVDPMVALRYE
jgi:putative ABC transport system permease protein